MVTMLGPVFAWHCLLSRNIVVDDSCAAVYWVEELTSILQKWEHQWILGGAPETCSRAVPVKLREVPVKYYVYPWNAEFTREKLVLSGAPPELAQNKPYVFLWSFFDPKALTDLAEYFGPKQPTPEPRTHSFLQKNKTVVKLSTSWLNLVFNANAKFNLAFVYMLS